MFVVAMQIIFGAMEIFIPRFVFGLVLDTYPTTKDSPVWLETEKVARNMGLYNWFLAFGLLLSLTPLLGGASSWFFLLCVALAGVFGLFSVGFKFAFGLQLVLGFVAFLLVIWGGHDGSAQYR